jgi:hypothetical protein
MSDVNYWKGQLDRLQANPPKSHENFYNQSFVDRMNKAQANIDGLVAEKDKSWAATQQAQDDYETFKGSMTSYRDAYKNAQAEFGVENAMANYDKSKKALAMAEMTLNALPSQINAGSNRVLTQSQREQQYNVLSNQFNKVQTYQMKQNKTYEEAWKNAREDASAYAQSVVSGEQSRLNDFNNAWINAMNAYNTSEEKWRNARIEKQMIGSDYRMWQLNQQNAELYRYQQELSNALKRYSAAMETQIYQNEKNMEGHEKLQAYLKQQDQATKEKLADNVIGWYHQDTLGKNRKRLFDYNGSGGGGGGSW